MSIDFPRPNANDHDMKITDVSSTEKFLIEFHRKNPSCSSRSFALGRSPEGLSSYGLLVRDIAPGDRPVLDIACGDGFMLSMMRQFRGDQDLVGLDMSDGELAAARQNPDLQKIKFVAGNARSMPFEDAVFGSVTCHMAFMLMPDAHEILSEVRRVLRPGGVFSAIIPVAPPPPSPILSVFTTKLQQLFEQEGKTLTINLADPRLASAETRNALFKESGFTLTTEPVTIRYDLSPETMAQFYMDTYRVAFLSEKGQSALRDHMRTTYGSMKNSEGRIVHDYEILRLRAVRD